jgi:hypothetical protein
MARNVFISASMSGRKMQSEVTETTQTPLPVLRPSQRIWGKRASVLPQHRLASEGLIFTCFRTKASPPSRYYPHLNPQMGPGFGLHAQPPDLRHPKDAAICFHFLLVRGSLAVTVRRMEFVLEIRFPADTRRLGLKSRRAWISSKVRQFCLAPPTRRDAHTYSLNLGQDEHEAFIVQM